MLRIKIEQSACELLRCVRAVVVHIENLLRSHDDIIRDLFRLHSLDRRLAILKDILAVILRDHGGSVAQLAEIIVESLFPLHIARIIEHIVKSDISTLRVEGHLTALTEHTGARAISHCAT